MALYNLTSMATTIFMNYSYEVFGSPIITSIMLLFVIMIIALLVKIPLPITLALLIPISLVMMAIGWLPVVAGAIIIVILMVIAGFTISMSLI